MIFVLTMSSVCQAGEVRWVDEWLLGKEVTDVEAGLDGETVAAIEVNSNYLAVFRTDVWWSYYAQPCEKSSLSGLAAVDTGYAVGCSDGTVVYVDIFDRVPYVNGSTRLSEKKDIGVQGLGEVQGQLYAIADNPSGGNPEVYKIDPKTGELSTDEGWPSLLGSSGFEDAGSNQATLIIAHGGDNVSKVDTSTGSATVNQQGATGATCKDVSSSDITPLFACGLGVAQFEPTTNDLSLVLNDPISDARGLHIDEVDERLWVADADNGLMVFTWSPESGLPGDEVQVQLDLKDRTPGEMTGIEGYAFAGTEEGAFEVFTSRPWTYINEVLVDGDPKSYAGADGSQVSMTFEPDTQGPWRVVVGKTELATGQGTPFQPVTVDFVIDERFAEGDNPVQVLVTDAEGEEGRNGILLNVDNPPEQVDLKPSDVKWGDGELTLEFEGIEDEDLESYKVYLAVTEFDPADYPEGGGPTFDGEDQINLEPVPAKPGENVSVTISPLTNDVTYYLAVRAIDAGGLEGPMSDVVSGTPQETYLASELAGEEGGCQCGGGPGGLGWLALGLSGLVAARRRRSGAVLGLGAAAVLGLAPVDAQAAEPWKRAGLEVRLGALDFYDVGGDDNPVESVYGDSGNLVFMVEGGPTIYDLVQLEFGVGRFYRKGNPVSADGDASGSSSSLAVYPLTVGARLRLDVIKEQWVVPTVAAGYDYWLWSERSGFDSESLSWAQSAGGGKPGMHYSAGIQILLDAFQPRRATLLEARHGIRDSYVVIEYREQEVQNEDGDGLVFSGSQVTGGLRVGF